MSLIGNPLVSTNYQTNTFSGDGTTVAYTLSLAPASAASIAVYISGLYQTPSVAYTVSGTTLTFTGAPPTGTNNILVLHLGIKSSTLVPVDGSVTPSMLSNANVVFWSGANTNVGIGNTAPNAPLTIGAANGTFTNPLVQAASSANSWLQINAQNKSNGNNASTDLILARSDGNDSVGYIDMGINSNTYAQAAYSIMTPSSGYLFTNGGDLVLGTQTAHNILFHTGNTTSASERMRIDSSGNFFVGDTVQVESAKFSVKSAKTLSSGIPVGQMLAVDSTALAVGTGGAINMGGVYNSGGGITSFASIEAYKENATSGSYGASMVFKTRTDGGAQTERMRINSLGYVTMPYQPSFRVSGSSTTSFSNGAIIPLTDGNGFNLGGFWNNTSYRFTAPVAGTYLFAAAIYVWNGSGQGTQSYAFNVNGGQLSSGDSLIMYSGAVTGGDNQTRGELLVKLNAGDYVDLRLRIGAPAVNIYAGHTYMWGYMVG